MSFFALLSEHGEIYARAAGQERWRKVTVGPMKCRVVELSAREKEMGLAAMTPETTHRGRCLPHPQVTGGRVMVVNGERAYLIVNARQVDHPRPKGHLALDLQEVPLRSIVG